MSIRVLLVDDHKFVRDSLEAMLTRQGDIVVVGHGDNGLQAIECARTMLPDVIVMDVGMPELGGVQATGLITDEMPSLKVLALSMHSEWGYVGAMLDAGACGYVLKDEAFNELAHAIRQVVDGKTYVSPGVRRSGFTRLPQEIADTEQGPSHHMPAAELLCQVVEIRDPYTAAHQRRVAELATAMAEDLGLSQREVQDIHDAALMHDVGKMSVPAEILAKPGALTSAELQLVRDHAEAGYTVLIAGKVDAALAELVYQHHERCDGSGYPRGLSADGLLIGARILAVADVVEAMSSHRPYRASLGVEAAIAEVEASSGMLYDAEVVESCSRLFRTGFVFGAAERASGRQGVIPLAV